MRATSLEECRRRCRGLQVGRVGLVGGCGGGLHGLLCNTHSYSNTHSWLCRFKLVEDRCWLAGSNRCQGPVTQILILSFTVFSSPESRQVRGMRTDRCRQVASQLLSIFRRLAPGSQVGAGRRLLAQSVHGVHVMQIPSCQCCACCTFSGG